jgi:hypothetical protein
MYQLFFAGLTYLDCLWQARRRRFNIVPSQEDALHDISMCMSTMEALAGALLHILTGETRP